MLGILPPLLTFRAGGSGQKSDLLIVADSGDFHMRPPRQFTN